MPKFETGDHVFLRFLSAPDAEASKPGEIWVPARVIKIDHGRNTAVSYDEYDIGQVGAPGENMKRFVIYPGNVRDCLRRERP